MKIRNALSMVVLVVATATGGVMIGGPALAADDQNAVAGEEPDFSSADCIWATGAEACFERHGDKIWVYDASGDDSAAYGRWDNYLKDAGGTWNFYRTGLCANHLGAQHWGYCNYDFYEDTTKNAAGGYGSGLRVWAATDYSSSGSDYAWIRNNA